ncbi:MAG: 3-isopropylmalate dehydratase large subunit [candidate division WOR-3 bacterium]
MGHTITEKILAAHSDKDEVNPGEHIVADVDFMVANDITAPITINIIEDIENARIKNEQIALVPDHFTPNKDIKSAQNVKLLREFSKKHNVKYFFETGRCGVEHCMLPEKGLVVPGDLAIGADSHTCTYGAIGCFSSGVGSTDLAGALLTGKIWLRVPETIKLEYSGKLKNWVYGKDLILMTLKELGNVAAIYKALEFTGSTISGLSIYQRLTMSNMAVEAGAKNGIFPPDEITEEYVKDRAKRNYKMYQSDSDAEYSDIRKFDVSDLDPQVSLPHLPSNAENVKDIGKIEIDQVFIGSCTNGWYEDLEIAAKVLKGKKVAPETRLIIAPPTPDIYMKALRNGLLEIFGEAEAVIGPPTCGPCLGGHMGILAAGEKAVATTNRNFVGRMGHYDSEVYLSNPAVAAASAVAGRIVHPEEVR